MRYGAAGSRPGWAGRDRPWKPVKDMDQPVSRTFPALPSALYEVRKFLREESERAGLSPPSTNDVVLAASEACANAVLHARSTEMEVTWLHWSDCVEITVRDEGVFIRRVPIPELDRSS